MDNTRYKVQENHKSELSWLAAVLKNHPKALLGGTPIVDTNTFYSAEAPMVSFDIGKLLKKEGMKEESSIKISLDTKNVHFENWWDCMETIQKFLYSRSIQSAIFSASERNAPGLIIDLAQDGLLAKLKSIYNEEVLPELAKKNSTIIDPDGKERTAKDVVSKQISEQYQAMLKRAKEVGIDEFELQKILKDTKSKFLAVQKDGKQ